MKVLKENTEEYLHDLRIGKDFIDRTHTKKERTHFLREKNEIRIHRN